MDPTCLPGRMSGINLHTGTGMVPPYQPVGGGLVMPNRGMMPDRGAMMPGGTMVGANANNHLDNARERASRSYLRKQNTVQCTRFLFNILLYHFTVYN